MRTKKVLLDIFKFIMDKKNTNIKEINLNLMYSERKIRYEIDNINFFLKAQGSKILITNDRGNIKFDSNQFDKKYLEAFFSLEKITKEERIDYICLKLILENSLNLSELERKFKISRTSIKSDFQESIKIFEKYNLDVCFKRKYFLKGLEYQKRLLLVNLLTSKLENLTHPATSAINSQNIVINYILEHINLKEISCLKRFITTLFSGEVKKSRTYKPFLSYLITSLIRIKSKETLSENPIKGFIFTTVEYDEIDKNIGVLENFLEMNIQKLEKIYMADFLLDLSYNSFENCFYKKSSSLNCQISKMVKDLERICGVEISRDGILMEGLLNHVKPAIYRMKNNIQIEKIEISDTEKTEIFDGLSKQVKKTINLIEKEYKIEFTEDEVLLLSIHIQASLERNKEEEKKIENIILFCSGGYATSTILKYKLEEIYDLKNIEIATPLDYDEISNKDVDLIITTMELKNNKYLKKSTPILKVNMYLGKDDLKKLDLCGLKRKKMEVTPEEILNLVKSYSSEKQNEELIKELENLFYTKKTEKMKKKKIFLEKLDYDNIFYEKEKISDWEKSIHVGIKYMNEKGFVEKIYGDRIIELIKEHGSYMAIRDGVIIPHARIDDSIHKTGMFLLKLENPVIFPENKMIDTLIFLSAKEKNDHIKGLEDLFFLLDEKKLKEQLDKAKDKRELVKIFKDINEKEKRV